MAQIDFKLVLLGGYNVGKSSLMERIIHDTFVNNDKPTTIGAAFAAKPFISRSGRRIVIGIWDTAGKERYEAMSKIFYRDAKVAIICYSICEMASWEKMKFWISELRENEEDCKIYLCGTKRDLIDDGSKKREVDFEMARRYAHGIQSKLIETSSKTGANVVEMFEMIVEEYLSASDVFEQYMSEDVVRLEKSGVSTKQPERKCFGRC